MRLENRMPKVLGPDYNDRKRQWKEMPTIKYIPLHDIENKVNRKWCGLF